MYIKFKYKGIQKSLSGKIVVEINRNHKQYDIKYKVYDRSGIYKNKIKRTQKIFSFVHGEKLEKVAMETFQQHF